MVTFAPTPQAMTGPGPNFNKSAFMAARPDISAAGFNFDDWYAGAGQYEDQSQFSPYMQNPVPGSVGGGVVPMTVEPLHQFEKQAYMSMGEPQRRPEMEQASAYLQNMMGQPTLSPEAQGYMGEAADFYRSGAAPLTMQEVEDLRNPYAQALKDRLTQSGERALAEVLARQGRRGAASFGDTATGTKMGYLQEELARKGSDIDYQTYESAFDKLLKQRELQRAGGAGLQGLGTATQGLTESGLRGGVSLADALYGAGRGLTGIQQSEADRQLEAGQGIRTYNQAIADMVGADILGRQQFEPQQLAQIQSLLDIYKSGTSTQSTPGANTLQQIGGVSGLFGEYLAGAGGGSGQQSTSPFLGSAEDFLLRF